MTLEVHLKKKKKKRFYKVEKKNALDINPVQVISELVLCFMDENIISVPAALKYSSVKSITYFFFFNIFHLIGIYKVLL